MLMILSCISMLIDHIGAVFYPDSALFRIIGRLAMPMYAYFIANGYKYTSDVGKYIKRIALTAVLSQIPFMLLFNTKSLNICFSWLFSLLIIYGIDKRDYRVLIITIITLILLLFTISIDYGFYGIGIPLLFFIRNKYDKFYKDFIVVGGFFVLSMLLKKPLQFLAIGAIPIILLFERYDMTRIKKKLFKLFYQSFYPVHMIVLLFIKCVTVTQIQKG